MNQFIEQKLREVVQNYGGIVAHLDRQLIYAKVRCSNHHTFFNKPRSIINGQWCPHCK